MLSQLPRGRRTARQVPRPVRLLGRGRALTWVWWDAGVFVLGAWLLLAVAHQTIARLSVTGDEPWYLLQVYALLRTHTPDLAAMLRNHALYAQLLGAQPDDHTRDYLGNSERMLTYLPGYAALIAPVYALGGRAAVVALQALAAALTGALVFDEAWRVFGSRRVAVFAWLAYL
ncbi:MAG TPA: hypothetical protein VGN32_14220, partial [Ktedonobacterales bacterium]|nr:hypothetical protein [Ktedonobacterales bacterium]